MFSSCHSYALLRKAWVCEWECCKAGFPGSVPFCPPRSLIHLGLLLSTISHQNKARDSSYQAFEFFLHKIKKLKNKLLPLYHPFVQLSTRQHNQATTSE